MITQERLMELVSYDPLSGRFCWIKTAGNRSPSGSPITAKSKYGYVRVGIDGRRYLAHRLAFLYVLGVFPDHEVDHINNNRADNSWANLRPAMRVQNARNLSISSRNTSGFVGVCLDKRRGLFRAYVRHNKRQMWLGYFASVDAAVAARRNAAHLVYGEFSPSNDARVELLNASR
jgi:hypothetical protein